ncbi:MAG: type IV pilus assembly protein PilW [Cocleimonas sp.]|jgi:type IV pilus assembly protein PilW
MKMMNTINKKYHFKHRQQGLSLIELMVSMVVGLFLLVGLVSSFINTKDTDRARMAISEMDATANLAFDVMRKTITHAGYVSIDPVIRPTPGFYTKNDPPIASATCRNGSEREPSNRRRSIRPTSDIANRDTITVISLADNPCRDGLISCPNDVDVNPQALLYYDCTGGGMTRDANTVACSTDSNVGMVDRTNAKIYSSFRLLLNNSSDKDRTLYCDGSRGGTQPIASNVEAVQYLYGVREDNDNVTFKNANTVRADNDWEKVRSVQVALLMRSAELNLLDADSSKRFYSLLDRRVRIKAVDRRRLFRVYTTTINLENMN